MAGTRNIALRGIALIAILTALGACSKAPEPVATAPASAVAPAPAPAVPVAADAAHAEPGVAWHRDDVDGAFARAKAEGKPVFLYWGATWCPPCNQVKATVFNRQDFIERSNHFVAVYVDGDRPSAQRLGARFKVSGYPTMILFTPDGKEISRLPGEVEADQYMRVLALSMSGARPIKETLAAALSPDARKRNVALTAQDWQMLAWYSWVTDDGELVPKDKVAPTLARLARACPATERATATRLQLLALAAAAGVKGAKPRADPDAARLIATVTTDAAATRANFDILTYNAGAIAGHVTMPKSAERTALVGTWDAALERLAVDPGLAAPDRLAVVTGRVELAKQVGDLPLPPALQQRLRDEAARVDRETTDPYARQAIVNGAAEMLAEAGMLDESDALLTAELSRSHSPYYAMLGLASNAKKRGDKARALEWHEKAYAAAVGPATRLQWGASYVGALIELAPEDGARIEQAASQVFGELEPTPDAFYDRSRRVLERVGKRLVAWNAGGRHADTLSRLGKELGAVCAKLPAGDPARAACDGVLRPAKPAVA